MSAIPVVMFHSVMDDRPDRPTNFPLWCGVPEFESYLRYLKWRGYATISLYDVHEFLARGRRPPERSIVLTFDDAYLDNWVVVAPLLRRYGFRGTVFVPTDFVQSGDRTRPTLDDVPGSRVDSPELECFGYLNRAEVRALAESGILDLQSHARTHTWMPRSDKVLTFHHPRLPVRRYLRWMWWNRNTARKPEWFRVARHEDLPWGLPVFDNDLALAGKAFLPNPVFEAHMTDYVASRGGASFFDRADWHAELQAEVESFRRDGGATATEESDDAFHARLEGEIRESRAILSAMTGKPVDFLCWPNGGVCETAFRIAAEAGYRATTIPSRMARGGNRAGDAAHQIRRIGSTPFFHGGSVWPKTLSFVLQVERARGSRMCDVPIKMIWLYRRVVPVRRPVEPAI